MLLHRLSRSTLQAFLSGAASLGALALMPAPEAKAACIGGDSVCTTFDPSTPSTPTDVGSFANTGFADPAPTATYTRARLQFFYNGAPTPITLTNILLKGDGIAGSLPLNDIAVTSGYEDDYTDLAPLSTAVPGSNLSYANNKVSFSIPAGLAPGSSISVSVIYYQDSFLNITQSNFGFTTTADAPAPVPGPLPLMGAVAAFGFSRQLRRRIGMSS